MLKSSPQDAKIPSMCFEIPSKWLLPPPNGCCSPPNGCCSPPNGMPLKNVLVRREGHFPEWTGSFSKMRWVIFQNEMGHFPKCWGHFPEWDGSCPKMLKMLRSFSKNEMGNFPKSVRGTVSNLSGYSFKTVRVQICLFQLKTDVKPQNLGAYTN